VGGEGHVVIGWLERDTGLEPATFALAKRVQPLPCSYFLNDFYTLDDFSFHEFFP
jgi:hypothetical protein